MKTVNLKNLFDMKKKRLTYQVKERHDLRRKQKGITASTRDAKLAEHNRIVPKRAPKPKRWGLFVVEKRGVKLLEKFEARNIATVIKYIEYDDLGIKKHDVRRKNTGVEGSYFVQAV